MAHDEELANRLRECVQGESGVSEKRMFGGLAFLVDGNLALSVSGRGGLLVRVDPEQSASLCTAPHVDRAVMGGRELDGWLRIDAQALGRDEELERWVAHGVARARSLPPK